MLERQLLLLALAASLGCSPRPLAGPLPAAQEPATFCAAQSEARQADANRSVFPDTLVRRFESPVSTSQVHAKANSPFAAARPWFVTGEGISFQGVRYSRTGFVTRWSTTSDPAHGEVYLRAGEVDGVPAYVPGDSTSSFRELYLAAAPPCYLQRYVDDRELA